MKLETVGPSYRVTVGACEFLFRDVRTDRDLTADVDVSHEGRHLFRSTATLSLFGREKVARVAAEMDHGDFPAWRAATFEATEPIRPYTTTFHAMQIGAFVGDFVFTFVKEKTPQPYNSGLSISELKEILATSVADAVAGEITEPQLRERAYRSIIPFLANRARVDPAACREAVDFFEAKMKEREQDFRQIRMKITEKRRRKFRHR